VFKSMCTSYLSNNYARNQKIGKPNNLRVFVSKKRKGHKQDNQIQHEGIHSELQVNVTITLSDFLCVTTTGTCGQDTASPLFSFFFFFFSFPWLRNM
jgi:hypothetical protein